MVGGSGQVLSHLAIGAKAASRSALSTFHGRARRPVPKEPGRATPARDAVVCHEAHEAARERAVPAKVVEAGW